MTDAGGTDPKAGTDGDEPTFDPRHNPVFQRGYDPASSAGPARRARRARRAERSHPADPVSPPSSRSSSNREVSTLPSDGNVLSSRLGHESGRDPGQGEAQATDAAGHAPQTPRVDDASATETRRNPFIVGLWIFAVVSLVGGVILQWQASVSSYNRSFNADEIPIEVIIQQLVWTITPTMISVGAMTLVGLVFWHAVTWRAARPVAADPRTENWPEPNQNE
ncbi:hypothetical protein [Glaciibacter superstes]|uniref:hypothetical protein n=1 Tax=Glaciibacter superstes TaxID=501023 RepID=UPI0003B6737A|nr:hypothetical protein [Glaciibacter superstes]